MGLTPLKMIDIPPVWLLGFAVLVWWADALMPMATGSDGLVALGTGLVTAGCVLIGVAALQFWQHKTTIIPHLEAASLITNGVFARSRNPIYLADAIILAGLALRWDFAPGLLLVPVFMWLIQARFIHAEEARLRAAFGEAFTQYAEKTRRWL